MSDFKQLIKDVEGMPISKWKKIYPNFYAWLMRAGFRYVKKKDKTLKPSAKSSR